MQRKIIKAQNYNNLTVRQIRLLIKKQMILFAVIDRF